jgi:hypothetical protein
MRNSGVLQGKDGCSIVNDGDDDGVVVGAWTTKEEDNRSDDTRRV